jgi:hypothetical protein
VKITDNPAERGYQGSNYMGGLYLSIEKRLSRKFDTVGEPCRKSKTSLPELSGIVYDST